MRTAHWLAAAVLVSDAWPLLRAWRANRRTALPSALAWTGVAWLAWLSAACLPDAGAWLPYLALSLTGCAGVAVLGARRPGVGAWNFVVFGLLAALLLPLAEGRGRPNFDTTRLLFLGAVLAVAVVNYLPTRIGFAAAAVGVGCAAEVARLAGWPDAAVAVWGRLAPALAPWLGLAACAARPPATPFDAVWRTFRDRFGLLWALRQREQFNRAAANAGHAVELGWSGLRPPPPNAEAPQAVLLELLSATLKRFGPAEGEPGASATGGGPSGR